jgi:uncharacterized membrane protein YeaQ/YmgE (transglycosylase-associated protein family)
MRLLMGLASWLIAGLLAFLLTRFFPSASKRHLLELVISLLLSFFAGVIATALDFGGWSELEWRAILFAFLTALTAIALVRLFPLLFRRLYRS